ncbi:N-acyl-D-aspartate/D-glutamate deacylase [Sphingobium sp. OAS761]|uniref:N-acyl-D-amino-acid deacylase family protein n=1 Tax=Sphingobium sp. OAS761 TaxID=2817901 RepID=UPI0020A1BE4A|nr:amidohydrolase family protein [Sphingobium sp. OAS761]MCP1470332.1 N-acyl-D-aspartate/D-glutamate deacylase [Sphingobium sp. OAS761]
MQHDLVIKGGTVIDGTGTPGFVADLGIVDGRISEVGQGLEGKEELDATGQIVAPGFVDVHTHYDPQVLWDRQLTPSSWHGVTSVVAGNCGFSVAPVKPEGREILIGTLEKVEDMDADAMRSGITWDFESYGDYLDSLKRAGLAINFGGYVGHTPIRIHIMGEEGCEREATPHEIAEMKALVARSIREGALGFSTDRAGFILGYKGKPVPSVVATQEETEALMSVPAEIGQGIAHIAPGENYAWLPAFQRRIGGMINWSAILAYPHGSGRDYSPKAALLAQAKAEGAALVGQVTCRPIIQLLSLKTPYSYSNLPAFPEILAAAPDERATLYSDPDWRARLHAGLDQPNVLQPRWNLMRVAETTRHRALLGRSIADLAAERQARPFDVMIDLSLEDDLDTRFSVTFANDDEDAVAALLKGDNCIIGLSDAGAHAAQICDAVLPTDFLSRWVRDRAIMPIEQGVRKLTGELADVMRIDRGYLKPDMPADIVVFDLDQLEVGPIRRVHDFPGGADRLIADAPRGIAHILINGVPIRRNGAIDRDGLACAPGQILRSRPAA